MGVLSPCMTEHTHACSVSEEARKGGTSEPLEPELEPVVNSHVGIRVEPGTPRRATRALNLWVITSGPEISF